ncbi:receptor-transporting protein 3-like [Chanos chanos]|uniref:Receptor-transporting protein 3-like n=1 Tax=Chanos chanos TaxID=29144 RepID=A0A6J2WP17_CHACN|nr:receptor-transporting protein 3-like [Chanos chanos]
MTTDWVPSLWLDTFDEMEEEELDYNDHWAFHFNYNLEETLTADERRRGWKIYSHCAFGQFRCGDCSRYWRSARVVVLFKYRLRANSARGTVLMRPFGQACQRCQGDFYLPGFTKKNVEETLLGLFGKIRKNCYGEEEDDDDCSVCSERVRTRPHEASLCEACQLGICCEDD